MHDHALSSLTLDTNPPILMALMENNQPTIDEIGELSKEVLQTASSNLEDNDTFSLSQMDAIYNALYKVLKTNIQREQPPTDFSSQKCKELEDHLKCVFKSKIIDKFPQIRESVEFGYGSSTSNPYQFYDFCESYLKVDNISLYPENEKEEKEAQFLCKYFPFGDELPEDENLGFQLGRAIVDMCNDDFKRTFCAWLMLCKDNKKHNIGYGNVLIIDKTGDFTFR